MASSLLQSPLQPPDEHHHGDHDDPHHEANMALNELFYSRDAFYAVALPTSLATILSSIAVVFINDGTNGSSSGGVWVAYSFESISASLI